MKFRWKLVCTIGLLVSLGLGTNVAGPRKSPSESKTRNVVLIVVDGLRWQEVFKGPDNSLMNQEHGGVENIDTLRHDFWRARPSQSPEAGFPFMWKTVALRGQICGNQEQDSIPRVTN